jgi:hypothetical protein
MGSRTHHTQVAPISVSTYRSGMQDSAECVKSSAYTLSIISGELKCAKLIQRSRKKQGSRRKEEQDAECNGKDPSVHQVQKLFRIILLTLHEFAEILAKQATVSLPGMGGFRAHPEFFQGD